ADRHHDYARQVEAKLLDAKAGQPAVVIQRTTFTAPSRPAVWYEGMFRQDYHIGVRIGDIPPPEVILDEQT
ncbi:MAG: UTRA domain-containing protein, partial [Anaerolineales bacterium]